MVGIQKTVVWRKVSESDGVLCNVQIVWVNPNSVLRWSTGFFGCAEARKRGGLRVCNGRDKGRLTVGMKTMDRRWLSVNLCIRYDIWVGWVVCFGWPVRCTRYVDRYVGRECYMRERQGEKKQTQVDDRFQIKILNFFQIQTDLTLPAPAPAPPPPAAPSPIGSSINPLNGRTIDVPQLKQSNRYGVLRYLKSSLLQK